ncbi:hypothetical protein fugu_014926 [Takifugu bimaculatus]|uniref:alpha-1,6-mannosyl-glycoprotein 6-beta-N-acetylglucosaminyltransferase n=1 Tax=Takifugu bimaculatus TaxID=433685 RepID=A0A4Z2BZA3_9TELE|nr:hypothetical protein fugu_014926 [Takifugu bimaculatus]
MVPARKGQHFLAPTCEHFQNKSPSYYLPSLAEQGKATFLTTLHRYMEIHGTVYFETQRPPEVPAFVKNHGLLAQAELQQLLRRAKLFIGFGFPYEGPAPLEAIANGCIFLQPKFNPPHSSLNHEFFRGKPTSRKVSSQHPYAEQHVGRPHVYTVDFNNSEEFDAAIREIMRIDVEPYLPYEYTCEGMLERLHAYIQNQDFCSPEAPFPPVNSSGTWPGSPSGPFVPQPNSSVLAWASNASDFPSWPPLSALRLVASLEGQSCVEACQNAELFCEPALFRFINIREAFNAYGLKRLMMPHILLDDPVAFDRPGDSFGVSCVGTLTDILLLCLQAGLPV